jgi:hypothetical protein
VWSYTFTPPQSSWLETYLSTGTNLWLAVSSIKARNYFFNGIGIYWRRNTLPCTEAERMKNTADVFKAQDV